MSLKKSLAKNLEIMRKHFGETSVFAASDDSIRANVEAISTGSINLDSSIGVGGWPIGRLALLSGVESSGKSLLTLMAIKEAQKQGGYGIYIDAEHTYSPDWAERLGIDNDRCFLVRESDATKVFEMIIGKPKNKKRSKAVPGFLTMEDKECRKDLKFIIIDSVNALVPPMEQDAEVGASTMALLARFLPPVLRRLTPMLEESQVTCIIICQARENPGQMYGNTLTVSGGRALRHAASLWVDLGVIGGSAIENAKKIRVGHKIRAKIRKNKVAPPFKRSEFTIYYQRGISILPEIMEQALERNIINQGGAFYSHNNFPDGKIKGKDNCMTFLRSNKDFTKSLLNDIKKHIKEFGYIGEELDVDDLEGDIDSDQLEDVTIVNTNASENIKEEKNKTISKSHNLTAKVDFQNLTKDDLMQLGKEKKMKGLHGKTRDQLIEILNKE